VQAWSVLIGLVLLVSGCVVSGGGEEGSASECISPLPQTEALIEDGLTVAGGSLVDAFAVEVSEPNALGVAYLVAAEIDDTDQLANRGDIGVWGVGKLDAGPVFAIDGFAREFTDWGAAVEEGSAADEARSALEVSDEANAARECVSSLFNPYRDDEG
jgi:hypothetical protein